MVVGVLEEMSGCGGKQIDEVKETKVWTEKYDKEAIKEEYQYYHNPETNRRMKDGWYNSYYENGEYNEIGRYKEDVRDGEWSYFRENGKETKGVYKDGARWSGEFWIHVTTDSVWVETDKPPDDEKVWRGLFTYDFGLWNGFVLYWRNGNKRSEGHWIIGEAQGRWFWYYESGKVKSEVNYVDGKQEGEGVEYYESGKVKSEVN